MNIKTFLLKAFWPEESHFRDKGRWNGWMYLHLSAFLLIFAVVLFLNLGHSLQLLEDGIAGDVRRLIEDPTIPEGNENVERVTGVLLSMCELHKSSRRWISLVSVGMSLILMQGGLFYLRVYHILNAEQPKCGAVPNHTGK